MIADRLDDSRTLAHRGLHRVTVWSSPAGAAPAGGDWYDVFALSENLVALTVGDVSGHGASVAGAMRAMHASIVQAFTQTHIPSQVLSIANETAVRQEQGVIVTAIAAIFDCQKQTIEFANAGHPPPLLVTPDAHRFISGTPADLPLGIYPQHSADNYAIALPQDALVVLYTDGVTEHARNPIAGERELVEAARFVHGRPELNAARAIARRVFARGRGDDDAVTIGLRTLSRRMRGEHAAPAIA